MTESSIPKHAWAVKRIARYGVCCADCTPHILCYPFINYPSVEALTRAKRTRSIKYSQCETQLFLFFNLFFYLLSIYGRNTHIQVAAASCVAIVPRMVP